MFAEPAMKSPTASMLEAVDRFEQSVHDANQTRASYRSNRRRSSGSQALQLMMEDVARKNSGNLIPLKKRGSSPRHTKILSPSNGMFKQRRRSMQPAAPQPTRRRSSFYEGYEKKVQTRKTVPNMNIVEVLGQLKLATKELADTKKIIKKNDKERESLQQQVHEANQMLDEVNPARISWLRQDSLCSEEHAIRGMIVWFMQDTFWEMINRFENERPQAHRSENEAERQVERLYAELQSEIAERKSLEKRLEEAEKEQREYHVQQAACAAAEARIVQLETLLFNKDIEITGLQNAAQRSPVYSADEGTADSSTGVYEVLPPCCECKSLDPESNPTDAKSWLIPPQNKSIDTTNSFVVPNEVGLVEVVVERILDRYSTGVFNLSSIMSAWVGRHDELIALLQSTFSISRSLMITYCKRNYHTPILDSIPSPVVSPMLKYTLPPTRSPLKKPLRTKSPPKTRKTTTKRL
eukprot:TRINITY_DN36829_c0_g1_i1.p1 TRINITY_DN36829_c0_g1~~TRINITY_DN36829_c0_g1_i1.p1  ORF type:complete len:466 (+),score=90.51 TRINITY_DN36829_c0_g1_i1:242-1639(+)